MTPRLAHAAHRQSARKAPVRIVNSPTNPFRSGRPIDARRMTMKSIA